MRLATTENAVRVGRRLPGDVIWKSVLAECTGSPHKNRPEPRMRLLISCNMVVPKSTQEEGFVNSAGLHTPCNLVGVWLGVAESSGTDRDDVALWTHVIQLRKDVSWNLLVSHR